MKPKILYLLPCHLAENPKEGILSPFNLGLFEHIRCYFSEEIRTSRRFISSLKLGIKIDSLQFFELNKDTSRKTLKEYLAGIPSDITEIGVLSEAGCPGIADPGAKLVALVHEMGWKVIPVPGPSSIFLGLMGSGFNGQQFHFSGYLPIKQEDRIKAIKKVEEETNTKGITHIFIETPFRNVHLLNDLIMNMKPDSLLCIASNLTSADEFIQTKKIKDWRNNIPNIHKIPTIFLIGHKDLE